jgi:hypothetical protein
MTLRRGAPPARPDELAVTRVVAAPYRHDEPTLPDVCIDPEFDIIWRWR